MDVVVDFAALDAAEADMRAAVERIEQQLGALGGFLGPLTATWSGCAADAYHAMRRRWEASAADVVASLADLHGLVVTAHRNQSAAVRANTRMWSS